MWWLHVIVPIISATVVNGIVFGLGWNQQERNRLLPPGYIIGAIWIIILGLLGFLHYLLRRTQHLIAAWAVVLFIVFCLLYPFITSGLKMSSLSKVLNLVTLIFAFVVAVMVPKTYIYYMAPLIIWASYVNVTQLID